MKNRIFAVLFFILLFSISNRVSASETCSPNGYTIFTINGILNDNYDAIKNKDELQRKFSDVYNKQPLKVDYLYNATHLAGIGDAVDAVQQGLFNQKSDYDLVEMINEASEKIKTQKVILVGHSQGNFYANNFYEKIASQPGGVPKESIGVYGVASPANYVAGGGKYITSDTDEIIIAKMIGHVVSLSGVLPPNVHIPLEPSDGNGHSFSDVYLKYQSDRIISEIKDSLNKLKENDEQVSGPCISPVELNNVHKIMTAFYSVADPAAGVIKDSVINSYKVGSFIASGAYNIGGAIGGLLRSGTLALNNLVYNILANAVNSLPGGTSNLVAISPEVMESVEETNATLPDTSENPENSEIAAEENITQENNNSEIERNSENQNIEEKNETPVNPVQPPVTGGVRGSGPTQPEIIKDVTPPIITIIGNNPVEVFKDSIYEDAGATAQDETDGERNITTSGTVDTSVLGTYTITYTASDLSNNISTATRTINVIDPPPPPPPKLIDHIIDTDITLAAGEYTYENLIITNNAVLTLEGDNQSASSFKGVKINAINITVDSGSSISANGKGYSNGPGTPMNPDFYGGGSYGGVGDANTTALIYGSAKEPIDLGSGGMDGNRGGGAIRLVVSDTLTNNGMISANGNPNSSGGSIYVTAKNIKGNGTFEADGGNIHNGYRSGGGGRITLSYENLSFSGMSHTNGGCGTPDGFNKICGENGTVGFIDTLNNNLYVDSSWRFQKNDDPFNYTHIIIDKGAKVKTENNINISANDLQMNNSSQLVFGENQNITIPLMVVNGSSSLTFSKNQNLTIGSLSVIGNSIITTLREHILTLNVSNLNIENGSVISADGKGYKNSGPGAPLPLNFYGGASYGGLGWNNVPESIYGSETEPVDFGSGGTGVNVSGGGALRLIVSDTLTNNGVISANGDFTSSGGSIYVTTKNVTGNGSFLANGGSGTCSNTCNGPGGGGRIALYYKSSSFNGNVLASGNSGSLGNSQPGTIKIVDQSIPILSSEKKISSFDFSLLNPIVVGVIDESKHTISLSVPFGTNVLALIPTITISSKAVVIPNSNVEQNFLNPVTYKVTAEDGSTIDYVVTVNILPDPNPGPDVTPPSITSFSLNGSSNDITLNPTKETPLNIVLNSSENVNWMTIKIENTSDHSVYKVFQDSATCLDGTNVCNKKWEGDLSKGTVLQNSTTYKIKVHMQDAAKNDYEEYLPVTITIKLD